MKHLPVDHNSHTHTVFGYNCTPKLEMQQRIVIRVLDCTKKKQLSKAMQIAVSVSGIERVALRGENKDHIEIVGAGIDAVNLTSLLRKKLGSVELISVIPTGELETPEEEYTYGKTYIQAAAYPTYPVWTYPTYQPSLPPYSLHDVRMSNQDNCVIL